MCGFAGFTGIIDRRETVIRKMADRIIHRGPDSDGYHVGGGSDHDAIALGFRRLSIIDLAAGSQPMYNEDGFVKWTFFDDSDVKFAYQFEATRADGWYIKNVSDNTYIGRCVDNSGNDAGYSGKVSATSVVGGADDE